MVDAALGAELNVESLDGETITFAIPAGTQPAERIVVEGKGMPQLRNTGNGNMIAHVDVTVPTALDETSRSLLTQLREHRDEAAKVSHAGDGEESLFDRIRNKFRR